MLFHIELEKQKLARGNVRASASGAFRPAFRRKPATGSFSGRCEPLKPAPEMTALAVNNAKRYSRIMENAGSSLLDSSTFSFAAYFWSTLQVKPMLSTGGSCLKVRSSLFARRGPGGEVSWRRARGLGAPGKAASGRLSAESGPEGPGSRRPRTSPRANFCLYVRN